MGKDYEIFCGGVFAGYLNNGTDGANGTNGTDGEQGPKGDAGDAGADGADGSDGIDGTSCEIEVTTGADAVNGDLKIICGSNVGYLSNGGKGDTGAPGGQGDKGDDGADGDDGTSCLVEATTGAEMANGDFAIICDEIIIGYLSNGSKGDTGAPGGQGSQGVKGDKGDKGDTGASCSVAEDPANSAYLKMTCGGTSESWPKAMCGSTAYDPAKLVCKNGIFTALIDVRDSKEYKIVYIGDQVWMAENLNYDVPDNDTDVCYSNNPSNCVTYGRLYNWSTAMGIDASYNSSLYTASAKHRGICPAGWHIPSDAEWTALTDFVGGASTAGSKLKAASGWNSGGNGTDDYGFSALPGGYGFSGGSFLNVGSYGYWWSASEHDASYAYYRYMYYDFSDVYRFNSNKASLFSVLCLQD